MTACRASTAPVPSAHVHQLATASSEGLLTLSANGEYLIESGYDTTLGGSKLSETSDTSVPRTLGRVAIFAGQLYTSSDPTKEGISIATVGSRRKQCSLIC
jgi:hypothetical protein